MNKLISQILKFGIVGGSAFLIDYGLLIFLTEVLGLNYLVSSAISFTISVVWNYILSVKWVFVVKNRLGKTAQFTIFLVLSILGLGLNTLLMWVFVEKFKLVYFISKFFVTAIVMVYNFISRKIFLED